MYNPPAESKQYQDAATRIATEVALPNAAQVDADARFPQESIDALMQAGLMGLCVPSTAGGKEEGPRTFAAVVEELATACASTAMIYVMHVSAAQASFWKDVKNYLERSPPAAI